MFASIVAQLPSRAFVFFFGKGSPLKSTNHKNWDAFFSMVTGYLEIGTGSTISREIWGAVLVFPDLRRVFWGKNVVLFGFALGTLFLKQSQQTTENVPKFKGPCPKSVSCRLFGANTGARRRQVTSWRQI